MATLIATTWLAVEVTWRPAIAPMRIISMGALLAVLAAAVYARSFRGQPLRSVALLAMRLGAIAAMTALLLGPSITPPSPTELARSALTILLDTSGSMLTEDCGPRTRLKYIIDRWLTPKQIESLERDFDVRLVGFD